MRAGSCYVKTLSSVERNLYFQLSVIDIEL